MTDIYFVTVTVVSQAKSLPPYAFRITAEDPGSAAKKAVSKSMKMVQSRRTKAEATGWLVNVRKVQI